MLTLTLTALLAQANVESPRNQAVTLVERRASTRLWLTAEAPLPGTFSLASQVGGEVDTLENRLPESQSPDPRAEELAPGPPKLNLTPSTDKTVLIEQLSVEYLKQIETEPSLGGWNVFGIVVGSYLTFNGACLAPFALHDAIAKSRYPSHYPDVAVDWVYVGLAITAVAVGITVLAWNAHVVRRNVEKRRIHLEHLQELEDRLRLLQK